MSTPKLDSIHNGFPFAPECSDILEPRAETSDAAATADGRLEDFFVDHAGTVHVGLAPLDRLCTSVPTTSRLPVGKSGAV